MSLEYTGSKRQNAPELVRIERANIGSFGKHANH
jgi:hypothetical protein